MSTRTWVLASTLLSCSAAAACDGTAPSQSSSLIGRWGGEDAELVVTEDTATLELPCQVGAFAEPPQLVDGRFEEPLLVRSSYEELSAVVHGTMWGGTTLYLDLRFEVAPDETFRFMLRRGARGKFPDRNCPV